MNKAFVNEDIDNDAEPIEQEPVRWQGKNYITPEGLKKLQGEIDRLQRQERPQVVNTVAWAASNGDRSENADYQYGKRRLREIDRRVRFLLKRLDQAEVVDPRKAQNREQVFFGATVSGIEDGEPPRPFCYTIVGEDESDAGLGRISWTAPLARALLGRRVGDQVRLQVLAGVRLLEIDKIDYPE